MKCVYDIKHNEYLNGIRVISQTSKIKYGELPEKKVEHIKTFEELEQKNPDGIFWRRSLFKKRHIAYGYLDAWGNTIQVFKENFKEYIIEEYPIKCSYCSFDYLKSNLTAKEFMEWIKDTAAGIQLSISIENK